MVIKQKNYYRILDSEDLKDLMMGLKVKVLFLVKENYYEEWRKRLIEKGFEKVLTRKIGF